MGRLILLAAAVGLPLSAIRSAPLIVEGIGDAGDNPQGIWLDRGLTAPRMSVFACSG